MSGNILLSIRDTITAASDTHTITAHLLGCWLGRFNGFSFSNHCCSHPITTLTLTCPASTSTGISACQSGLLGLSLGMSVPTSRLYGIRFTVRLAFICVSAPTTGLYRIFVPITGFYRVSPQFLDSMLVRVWALLAPRTPDGESTSTKQRPTSGSRKGILTATRIHADYSLLDTVYDSSSLG